MTDDLFPEIEKDKEAAARRRLFSRHRHAAITPDGDSNDERYTLMPTLLECMKFAGVRHIDIDVAGCPEAHVAEMWHGRQSDGTFRDALSGVSWRPPSRIPPLEWTHGQLDRHLQLVGFDNMPYTQIQDFIERGMIAVADAELDVLIHLMPGDRCEQPAWQEWIEPYRDGRGKFRGVSVRTKCLAGRQKFGTPGDPKGLLASSAPFPSVCVVFDRRG